MAHHANTEFVSLNIAVLTLSDSRTLAEDTSGDTLVERLQAEGHRTGDRAIIKDDIYQLRAQVSQWIADPVIHAVLITGGTGFTSRDTTPEAVMPLFDKQIEGYGELFRQLSFEQIGSSTIQSRAVAGVAKLEAAIDPQVGTPAIKYAYRADEVYSGAYRDRAPDIRSRVEPRHAPDHH